MYIYTLLNGTCYPSALARTSSPNTDAAGVVLARLPEVAVVGGAGVAAPLHWALMNAEACTQAGHTQGHICELCAYQR